MFTLRKTQKRYKFKPQISFGMFTLRISGGLLPGVLSGADPTAEGTARGLFGSLLPSVGLKLSFAVEVTPFLSRDGLSTCSFPTVDVFDTSNFVDTARGEFAWFVWRGLRGCN